MEVVANALAPPAKETNGEDVQMADVATPTAAT
jgi:hypothetical protein